MKTSEMFRKAIKDDRTRHRSLVIGLQCVLSSLCIGILLNYKESFKNEYLPFYIIAGICIFTILIIVFILKYPDYCKLTDSEYKIIEEELKNKIERGFPQYGIYLTENYLVHISNSISTNSFATSYKDILAISNYGYGGYIYNKKKRRNTFFRIFLSNILDVNGNSTSNGQSVIVVTNKKRYRLGYYYFLNGNFLNGRLCSTL